MLVGAMVVDGLLALITQSKPNTRASRVADVAATNLARYAVLSLGGKIAPPSISLVHFFNSFFSFSKSTE